MQHLLHARKSGGIGNWAATAVHSPDAKSVPGFVSEEQGDEDITHGFDVTSFGVDPATTRYQGEWAGDDFLPSFAGNCGDRDPAPAPATP
jgi:hypothetical protein